MMPVYMIVPVGTSIITQELEDRIKSVIASPSDMYMLLNRNACYVAFNGISTELRDRLNLGGKNNPHMSDSEISEAPNIPPISAIIISVVPGGFNGYAPTDIWEWLNLKMGPY
ncbi:hypothetical protein [Anaerobiospirillum thomasii]|uniref:hypothetical protein n=1 Tax=Anaerobiospirillum thomasii TaxID=179995 RepID=UPI0011BECD5A|nr:hypothetical protein [Anaerobiospirillum thomasii]